MSVEIDVLRAFALDGARVEPGRRVTVGDGLAAELIAAGKAVRARANKPSARPPARPAPPAQPARTDEQQSPHRAPREQE